MSATNPIESPIVNANPIVNVNPIVNNPIESPIAGEEAYNPDYDISCGCSASVPPGSRVMFMKFAIISMVIGSLVVYGFFKLSQHLGWM